MGVWSVGIIVVSGKMRSVGVLPCGVRGTCASDTGEEKVSSASATHGNPNAMNMKNANASFRFRNGLPQISLPVAIICCLGWSPVKFLRVWIGASIRSSGFDNVVDHATIDVTGSFPAPQKGGASEQRNN